MKNKIIFLKPYISQTIWGGKKLSNYNYFCPYNTNGEAWNISAIPEKSSLIINKDLENITLLEFFEKNKNFFNNYSKPYPLLTKIIDANDDLSVQVHPNDKYALKKHNSYGKAECWYVLDCPANSSLIYGHKAKDLDELKKLVDNNEWNNLLLEKSVNIGDVIYVPPGTIHAIKKNILVFELQQSSDITYRFYDYDRKDINGNKRELHIDDAFNVTYFPQNNLKIIRKSNSSNVLIESEFFKLEKINNNGKQVYYFPNAQWVQATVINGFGSIDNELISKGSTFLVAHNHKFELNGSMELLISYIE
ncbi:type I phosphomannose isomerase catalytic subunit [Mycoplasmoides alvi]|uniref:type I phosphomannose isomerase catalytic subunit n=1 Tax=Mycoplasmoides alvi TaxID=78580 RepID=UPI00051C70C1|nr:type I phosphomannose isomerase catalytic subunit [Mycoplasmoides alvi]